VRAADPFASAESAEEAFYDAMRRGDLDAMMALWADEDEVVCAHPSGARLVGLPAIRASFEEIFAGGGVRVQPAEIRVHAGGLLAVHSLLERIVVDTPGGPRRVECAVTNAYVKTVRGWRMVLHHASPPLEQPAGEPPPTPPSTLLH
jgi:ketosteroid isomerase-like protein